MSAIDDAYSPISACIDMIQVQNETFTIWFLHKVVSFVRYSLLEDGDVG